DLDDEETKEKRDSLHEDLSEPEKGGIREVRNLPCRISISISGLEWFVYNRSPAYDAIIGQNGQSNVDRPTTPQGDNPLRASSADLDRSLKGRNLRVTRLHGSKDGVLSSADGPRQNMSPSSELRHESAQKEVDVEHES